MIIITAVINNNDGNNIVIAMTSYAKTMGKRLDQSDNYNGRSSWAQQRYDCYRYNENGDCRYGRV